MLKKSAILGLVLLLAGTIVLQWILIKKKQEQQQTDSYKSKYGIETNEYLKQYNQWLQLDAEEQAVAFWGLSKSGKTKTEAQLQLQQRERLKADMDRLAAGEMQTYPFADVLYGENWQNELRKYKSQKELRESIFTSSIVCTSTGAAVFSWCLLLWTARHIISVSYRLKFLQPFLAFFDKPFTQIFADFFKNKWQTKGKKLFSISTKKSRENSEQEQNLHKLNSPTERYSKALINLGWQNPARLAVTCSERPAVSVAEPSRRNYEYRTKHLYSPKDSLQRTPNGGVSNVEQQASTSTSKLEDSLKTQAENLEKRMSELKQMAKTVQQTTLENSKPLNNTLKELTEQVSAIRQYAACQQNRMEKLQDGYDWNIIRTFCLRIIRCVDNLENRISQLSKENVETTDLKEIKDELLFALESSGVEQFEPEINSDYRSQEKFAEAIKDKQKCDNPKQTGKIAKVIKPGYQYIISEDNVKIVRTAQVKLFG
jgi:molecular chaperone GrpE (heat shock protein)